MREPGALRPGTGFRRVGPIEPDRNVGRPGPKRADGSKESDDVTGLTQAALLLCAGFAVWFLVQSDPRQRIAVFLGWLVPGAGHLYLGRRDRALFLGCLVIGTFVAGMVIADFCNISPFDRHPIWGIAQLFGGLMSGGAALATSHLMREGDNPYYFIGCLYSGVACLMNLLVMIDAYDCAGKPDEAAESPEETAA